MIYKAKHTVNQVSTVQFTSTKPTMQSRLLILVCYTLTAAFGAVTSVNGAVVPLGVPAPAPPPPRSYPGLKYLGIGVSHSSSRADVPAYYASFDKARWSVAEEDCSKMTGGEGYLVAIETPEEDAKIHDLIRSSDVSKVGQHLWTSGAFDTDPTARVWRWVSTGDSFDHQNWEGDAPVFAPATARVAFRSRDTFNYGWTSIANGEQEENYYICEVPAFRNDTPVPCKRENDLVIVLDGSGSVSVPDFELGKEFSAQLASAFAPYAKSRVSFIVYSSTSQTVFDLKSGLTAGQIETAIRGAIRPGGGTQTDAAIDDAVAQLLLNPAGVPRKLVVLTDGVSNSPALTAAAAARATAAGVKSFSVGIGLNQTELLAIGAGDSNNVFSVANFEELIQVIAPVCVRVCAQ